MPDHYDRLENRPPSSRESALFRDLRHVLAISKPRVASLRAQLRGIDVAKLASRADLTPIPVMRRRDLIAVQAEQPPLGINATRLGGLKQTFVASNGFLSVEGQARDWWGAGRALFAAGLRKGMLVLNCFPYDLIADGHMMASGAAAVGCPVIPAGAAEIDAKVDAIARLRPLFFCGRSDELKLILDRAIDRNVDTTCLAHALLTGKTGKGLRSEFAMRGIVARHAYMLPELGVVAYECGTTDGMTVNEGLIVEIVDPATGRVVATRGSGELVVTRINADLPVLRYATGAWAAACPVPSTCGRTNMRITAPHERTPDYVDMAGRRIHISDIVAIARHFPAIDRMSLVTRRRRDADELHLRVECGGDEDTLLERLSERFHLVTRLRGTVERVASGTLSPDDALIIDERHLN